MRREWHLRVCCVEHFRRLWVLRSVLRADKCFLALLHRI